MARVLNVRGEHVRRALQFGLFVVAGIVLFPMCFLSVALVPLWFVLEWWQREAIKMERRENGQCVWCGYEIGATRPAAEGEEVVCPECGSRQRVVGEDVVVQIGPS